MSPLWGGDKAALSQKRLRQLHLLRTWCYYFYEAAFCQTPFPFYMSVTPSVVNRACGFLKREACICPNELLSVLASFRQTPMLYSPKGDLGSAGEPEGGVIPSKNKKCKCSILLRNRSFDSCAYNAHYTVV
jgi:hypothetical protein